MKKIILILTAIAIIFLVVLYQHLSTTGMVEHRIFARKSRYYVVGKVRVEEGRITQFNKEVNEIS